MRGVKETGTQVHRPIPIETIINLMAMRLVLPRTMRSHEPSQPHCPSSILLMGAPPSWPTIWSMPIDEEEVFMTGRAMDQRRGLRCLFETCSKYLIRDFHNRHPGQPLHCGSLNSSTLTACPSTPPVSEEDSVPEEDLIMEHEEPSSQPPVV